MNKPSTLRIGLLLPEVLGTYGDSGNSVVLRQRAIWRGISAEIIQVHLGQPFPTQLDIYTMGGGEDVAQALAAQELGSNKGLSQVVADGKPVLAICAAMQVLGQWYQDATGKKNQGIGLLDCYTVPQGKRAIGELVTQPLLEGLDEPLTGFENHGGATILGPEARPLGKVQAGIGNGAEPGKEPSAVEGAVQGSVVATYMHGPVLARNPQLADYLLTQATGISLEPLSLPAVTQLRTERLQAALGS